MKKFYPYYLKITSSTLLTLSLISLALSSAGQDCSTLTATFKAYESRCAATGSVKVVASGGSGSYKYKATGPVNTNFTSTDSITGLQAGTYTIEVKDILTNCTFIQTNVIVGGNYQDIRFSPAASDITCEGGSNGSITLLTKENGRAPFTWTIMAPSAMGVGTSNNTGNFNNLIAGDYSIRMTDSCGGIQTRVVTIHDYSWAINSYSFTKTDCNTVNGYIKVTDSKNNISTVGGIPGFKYGIVRAVGDTFWSPAASFTASIPGLTSFDIVVKDGCGKVKKGATSVSFLPSLGASVTISNKNCSTFSAALTSISNFFSPSYSLYDNNNTLVATNATGSFNNIPYGSYCIKAFDGCTSTTISRCFTVAPPALSIGNTVAISNKNCTTFTASVTSKVGLTSPTYYLYDNSSVLIATNNTGVFNNIAYGSYSITTKDGCRDTTIQRFFSAKRWVPKIASSFSPKYITCDKFGLALSGDSLTGPTFCIYDGVGTEIACNSTGIFDSLLLGTYTIKIHDACIDTTIVRTITVSAATITNDVNVNTTNTGCNAFRVNVQSSNLKNPLYTLYTDADVIIGSNNTGVFYNIPAGSYYVKAKNSCPDTTFRKNFSIAPLVPSVWNTVKLSNYNCSTFTATIQGPKNLTTPQYDLYDNNNVKIATNTNGVFNNIQYGSYCIKVTNSCYDTVITRCFTSVAPALDFDITSWKSCSYYGNSKFKITINSGEAPYTIYTYNTMGDLLYTGTYSSTTIYIENIPGIVDGRTYKFIATDNCNKSDSVKLIPEVSSLQTSIKVTSVCPGDTWPNGSGKIDATVETNMGSLTISIVKKNGVSLSPVINPTYVTGSVYTFDNLEPATYIISRRIDDWCSDTYYDTVTVSPYKFPSLQNSSAYQCDVNGFTIGATATNGVAPFTYEIIGSFPSTPSIIAAPQASPLFNVDNGNSYSLVRLRALDACGNATLGDVSILPLADNKVFFSDNCFMGPTTLQVDPIYNSNYTWSFIKKMGSTDTTLLGSGSPTYSVSTLLPSDTGIYICKISVAGGCVSRTYNTRLDGSCYKVLSNESLKLSGRIENEIAELVWSINEQNNINSYTIERKNAKGDFEAIGTVNADNKSKYNFSDLNPRNGTSFYRLKLNYMDQTYSYSNIVALENNRSLGGISIFPNPVIDFFTVDFSAAPGNYKVVLMTLNNQVISQQTITNGINSKLVMKRNNNLSSGLYLVRIIDINSNKETIHKIIFK